MMRKLEGSSKLANINFPKIQDFFIDRNVGIARMKFKIWIKIVYKIPEIFRK